MADAASEFSRRSKLLLVSEKIFARKQGLNRSKARCSRLQAPALSPKPSGWIGLTILPCNLETASITLSQFVCEIRQKFAGHVSLDKGINRWESLVPSCPINGSILHTQSPNLYFGSKTVTKNYKKWNQGIFFSPLNFSLLGSYLVSPISLLS